jgi:hypothetical protein
VRVQVGEQPVERHPVAPYVGLAPDLCINRNEIGPPLGLDAIAAEEDERGGAGLDFARKLRERIEHTLLGEILSQGEGEAESERKPLAYCDAAGQFGSTLLDARSLSFVDPDP